MCHQGVNVLSSLNDNQSIDSEKNLNLEERALEFINQGKLKEAENIYRGLINKGTNSHFVYSNLAIILGMKGKNKEMIRLLERSIEIEPNYPQAYNNLGVVLQKESQLDSAIDLFEKAIKLQPDYSDAYINLGYSLQLKGQFKKAIRTYQVVLQLDPKNIKAYNNLGIINEHQKKYEIAISYYKKALLVDPISSEVFANLGNSYLRSGNLDDAIASYKKSIEINANNSSTFNNLATSFKKKGLFKKALIEYKHALNLNPRSINANFNIAILLAELDDLDSAVSFYKACLQLNPKHVEAYTNLGIIYQDQGSHELAIENYQNALKIEPQNSKTRWNLAIAQLLGGNYIEGWKNYDWRLKNRNSCKLHSSPKRKPILENIFNSNEELLVISEQGLGDTIQYMRYIPYLRNQGIKVSFSAQAKLHNLIRSSGIDCDPLTPDEADLMIDRRWIPLLTVPKVLGVTPSNPITNCPYINTSAGLVRKWKNLLSYENKFIVGINWQGSFKMEQESYKGRSIPLESFSSLLTNNDIVFLSLQKGYGSEQLIDCSFNNQFVSCQKQIDEIWDFSENAAIMANCNLIITCDTSVAHLAGGMGAKVWLLLKDVPFWTWGLYGDKTFWYPSMRLFRQQKKYDWNGLMEKVAIELNLELAK